jgi:hypothetical protein
LRSYDEIPVVDSGSVDDRVREFFLKLPKEIVAQSDMVLAKGADVAKAASRCRILPGGFAEFIRDEAKKPINPLGRQRRQRMHELLLWQAERTLADHWFEPGPRADDPWYDVTGKSYVLSATKLFEDDQIPEELFKEAERVKSKFVPAQLRFLKLGEQRWTTENEFALAFQINADRIDADRGVPEGTPMVWLEIGTGKTADKVWPRKPMTTWPKFDDAYLLEQYGVTRDSVITVKLHAVYRGQHIIETAPLIRSQPNVIVRHPPALKENTAVSVRMDSNFDYGAVSIVLDNSTSMTYLHPKKGANQKPRFEYALDALEHVLRKVPDQTSLSVFTFGTSKLNVPTLVRQPSAWQQEKLGALRAELKDTLGTNIGSPIAAGIIAAMRDGFPAGFNGPKVIVVLTDGADTASFGGDGSDVQRIRDELRAANAKYPDVSVVMVLFLDKDADGESKKEFKSAEDQFKEIELFKPRGVFLPVPEGEKLGKSIEDLVRPRIQFLHLADQTPVTGFEKGYPINYHRDRALDWRKIASADYYGHVLQTSPNPLLNVQMSPGQRMFLVLNRSNEKLALRRGILAYQPETERRGEWRREKEGWVVSLLESETRGLKTSILKQLLAFEKREHEKDRIRQTVPGLAWLELEAAVGAKPDTTLRWWRDWTVPAPALRLEMREWPQNNQPKVTAWFVPDDRDGFFANRQLVVRASRTVPFRKKIGAEGVIGPEIEYIEWKKDQEVEGPKGDYINRDCLVVRVRHPKGRPVWVDLESRPAGIGSDHHYFHDAGSCTCYFYGLNRPEDANLVLIDLDAFKKTAQRVEFAPDTAIAAPRIFVPE